MPRKSAAALAESRERAAKLKAKRVAQLAELLQRPTVAPRRASMLAGRGGENTQPPPVFAPSVANYCPKEAGPEGPASFLIHVHKSVVLGTKELTSISYPLTGGETSETNDRLRRIGKLIGRDRGFWEWLADQTYYPEGEKPHDTNRHWVDMSDRAKKGFDCGDHLIFREYFTMPDKPVRLAGGNFCGQNHLCTFCSSRRAVRSLQRLVPLILGRMQEAPTLRPAMMTITQENHESLKVMMENHFAKTDIWLQRVRNVRKKLRRTNSLAIVDGGVGSCETKRGSGSGLWHFHAHWLVLVPPGLPENYFAAEWSELLGYDAQCKLHYCHSVKSLKDGELPDLEAFGKDCLEVIKYALKTTELGWPDRLHAWQTLRGRRLIRSFGSVFGFKPVQEETDDLEGLDDKPYREVVFNYFAGLYLKGREKYVGGENQEPDKGTEWVY